jgi:hypothetical protein
MEYLELFNQWGLEGEGLFGACFCFDFLAFCDWLFPVMHAVFFVCIATMADGR